MPLLSPKRYRLKPLLDAMWAWGRESQASAARERALSQNRLQGRKFAMRDEKAPAPQAAGDKLSAILLAGGKSSRMGRDKAALPFRGTTLLGWQLQKLRGLDIENILLSGSRPEAPGVQVVADEYPARGPLGGLHACLKRAAHPDCLVLSVDVPLVPEQALKALAQAHLSTGADITLLRHGETWEPLIGVYKKDLFRQIEPILQSENTAVRRLLDQVGFETMLWPGDEALFRNCNTPEDYEALCQTP